MPDFYTFKWLGFRFRVTTAVDTRLKELVQKIKKLLLRNGAVVEVVVVSGKI
jgi:hypothetical protein